jgi:hypothetical protein
MSISLVRGIGSERRMLDPGGSTSPLRRPISPAMREILRSSIARVWVPALGAAAVVASLDRGGDTGDLLYFVHRGQQLLSAGWADTFSDRMLQSGPFQLAVLGAVRNLTAIAFLVEVGVAALLLYVLSRLAVPDRVQLGVGLAAVVTGFTHGAFVDGHPAQAVVPLLWVLAGLRARDDSAVVAGALVGFSAGFELWGLLGLPVLLLAPRVRRAVVAGLMAVAVAGAMLVPFVVAGSFRMFEYRWHVGGGTLLSLVVEPGTAFGWPLRLLQSSLALGAGAAVALALRRSLHAVWLAPLVVVLVRLALDPLAYGWYWQAAEALALVAAAVVLTELPTRFPRSRGERAAGRPHPAAAPPPARS